MYYYAQWVLDRKYTRAYILNIVMIMASYFHRGQLVRCPLLVPSDLPHIGTQGDHNPSLS